MSSLSPRSRRIVVSLVISSAIIATVLFGAITRAEFDPAALFAPSITATKSDTSLSGDPDGKADPGETIGYTVQINNAGVSPADDATGVTFTDTIDPNTTLAGAVSASAVGVNDTLPVTVTGNVAINSANLAAPFSVLTNDYLGTNPASTIATVQAVSTVVAGNITATSAQGGNVVMNVTTGFFTYDPAPGFEGADTFTYILSENLAATSLVANRTATVSLNVSGMIWFINNTAGACTTIAAGCGRLSSPFSDMASFVAVNGAGGPNDPGNNDNIFVYESGTAYTGLTLRSGQRLFGQDATASLSSITGITPPVGSLPFPAMNAGAPATTISGGAGTGVALISNNTVRGLSIGNSTPGLSGTGFGTLTLSEVGVNSNSAAIILNNGTANATFTSVTSTGGSVNVNLTNIAGNVNLGTGALSGATSYNLLVNQGTASISYSGTITAGNVTRPVEITNKTAGTVTLSGLVSTAAATTSNGPFMNSNTGATINFTGGVQVSTGSNPAFTATGGGTITATQNNTSIVNTLTTTSGTALNVANTTIGASGLTFRSITSGAAANGINLNTTGSGGLTVTGNGGSCTSAATCTGGNIQGTTGVGILMTSASNISLTRMNVQSTGDDGIKGLGVTNFVLDNSRLASNGNAVAENGLQFGEPSGAVAGLLGTVTISNTAITASAGNNVHIRNTSGTLDSFTVTNSSFNDLNDVTGANSFLFEMSGTAVTTAASMTGCTFNNNSPQRALEIQTHDTGRIGALDGSTTFTVSGSTFTNNGIHTSFTQDTTSNLAFKMLSNNMQLADPLHAINVFSSSTSTGGTIIGTIDGNTIGTAANASSGAKGNAIRAVIQGRTVSTLKIQNNTIRQVWLAGNGPRAMDLQFLGPVAAAQPITQSDILITNNDVDTMAPGTSFPLAAIYLAADNQGSPARVRAQITGNNARNSVAGGSYDYPTFDGNGAQLIFAEVTAGAEGQLVDTAPASANALAELTSANPATAAARIFELSISLIAGPINQPPAANPVDDTGSNIIYGFDNKFNLLNAALFGKEEWKDRGDVEADETNSVPAAIDGSATVTEEVSANTEETGYWALAKEITGKLVSVIMPTASAQGVENNNGVKPEAPQSGETVTVGPIGTLPAGKSVTITFSVTFDGPSPATEIITRVVNQGTVSSNVPNVLTTDPSPSVDPACTALPSIGTATCTPVDRPDTTVASVNRVTTSPTNAASVQWTVTFANAIDGLTASNLTLTDTTASCTGESLGTVTAVGGGPGATQWTVNANTGTGSCTLRLDVANSNGLSHDVTNLPFITGETIVVDKLAPSTTSFARFNPLTSPTNADTLVFRVTFSEAVIGVDATDFDVAGTTAGISVAPVGGGPDFTQYDVTLSGGNLASLNGPVLLNFNAAAPANFITDLATNNLPNTEPAIDETYLVDNTAPTVNIVDVSPDPRNTDVASIAINFNEDVTGFDIGDLTLTRDAGPTLLPGGASITGGPASYTLTNLAAITNIDGTYALTLAAPGGITDAAGNALVIGDTDTWIRDAAGPTVTIDQAVGQSDPTFANPINFTAVFNEPVTDFDDAADVVVTGTATGVGTATVVITPNSTTNYTVAISGITGDGTVIVNIPAGVAIDAATNPNVAATFTDNVVTFVTCIPPPANMLAWYSGDGTPRDIAGGNDGSLVGGTTYAAGKVGQAFSFPTNPSYVTRAAGAPSPLNLTGTQVTIDGWVNPTTTTAAVYFGKTASGSNDYLLLNPFGSQLQALVRTGTGETGINAFADFPTNTVPYLPATGVWTHLAMTYDGATVKIYANGVQIGSGAKTGNLSGSNVPFNIGGRAAAGLQFNGLIDEVEVFNRALLQSEIQSIVAADGGGKCKPSDLRVDKSHVGNFTQGTAASYSVVVSNDGPVTTSGTTTMTDTLPAGLVPGTPTGTGWTCPAPVGQAVSCTSTDAIASGGVFQTITIPVTVAENAALSLINTATVSGGGELDTSDNSDTDPTTIIGVAQTPSVTDATTVEDTQTTSGLVISRNATDGAEVTHFKITAITNGALFQNDGVTPIANNAFITFAQGNAGLKFTPNANFFGNGTFTVQASISNSDAGIGGGSAVATITVNAVADTPSVTNATTNEDVQTTSGLVISRNAGDGAEVTHFQITGITNGSLFQNDGTTPIADGAFITFAQGSAGLRFTPAANFFGNGSFQVQSSLSNTAGGLGGGLATATITVNAVADTPSVTNATTNEDIQTTSGLVITRNAADGAEVTHFKITAITNGTLFQNDGTTPITNGAFITFAQGSAGLRFTPNANFFGSGTFQIQASTSNADAGLGGGVITATITVNAIADTPSVTDATTNEDIQTTSGLVISRNAADGTEVTHFKITAITNGTLFQNDGTTAIANNAFITFAQGNAGLKFTPNANFFGNGTFQIQASVSNVDAGLGGGVITATITVNPVADTPSATNATTNEDTQTTSGLVISRNAADGTEVTHFKITNITNGTLFQNDGVTPIASNAFITFAQGNAGLKFTPSANFFGNGTFQVQASLANNDGGLGGGVITVTITVNPVADTPSVTNSTTNEDTQTTTGLVVSRNAADGAEVTHFKITNIMNGTLFQNDGTTPIVNNAFITFAQANAGLKFTPAANLFSPTTTFSFQVQASISNADAGLGGGVVTATITVNPVADTPSVTNATTVHGAQTTSGLVVSRNAVDGAEVTHFKITNITNGALFQNNGTTPIANNAFITFAQANAGLRFTPNIGFIGTATFQIQASVSNVDAGLGGGVITASIVVNKADTTTTVISSLNPSPLGSPVTFTSTTVITPPGAGPINGSVTFLDGASPIAGCSNVPVNAGGQAQCTTSTLTSGSHVITAQYLGSATFNTSSGTVTQVVDLPPTAAGTAPTVVTGGGTTHTVTVTYTDDFAINVASLDSNDIRVTGPNAFNSAVTFTGVNINTNGTPRVATYTFTAPGGSWDLGDNGTYSIVMQANQVFDSANQPVAAGSIGTFVVNIPPVTISGNIRQYVAGGPNTPLAGVTVTLTSNNVPVPGPATTNANGDYVITNVSHGANVVVTPSGLGKVYDPITRTFNNVTANTTADFIAYDPNAIPRTIRVVDTYPVPGAAVAVPIVMNSQGTETFVSFSLNYSTNPLAVNPTATCGAGTAPGCTVTFNNATPGQIGVTITNPVAFTAGPAEIAVINFQTLANTLANTPLTFGDAPVVRLVRDASGDPLPATYINGLIVFAQGLEGDVANRNTGNGTFESADVVQMRRFVAGLDAPVATNNEFQRADTAPAATKGDGNLNSTDLVQTRRYVAGLDATQSAGGPGAANAGPIAPPELERSSGAPAAEITIGKASGSTESRVKVPVGMRSNGDEVAVNFVIRYDAARLGNAAVELVNAPDGAILTANTDEPGVIRVLVDSSTSFARSNAIETLVNISFDIASTAPTGDTRILIDETTISDARATSLAVKTTNGTISIAGPNAVSVEIAGRVLTPNGSGLRNATVTLTDANGVTRTATTATFGYYRFEGLTQGESYTVTVSSRRFRFTQQRVTPSDNLTGIDFTGQE